MLRITRTPGPLPCVRIEGTLVGLYVEALRSACQEHLDRGVPFQVELAGTGFADPSGIELLGELAERGAELVGASPFLRELLRRESLRRRTRGDVRPAAQEEAELWTRCARGEAGAREELVRRYGPRLLATARRFLSAPGEAEQALHEAFWAAFDELPELSAETSLAAWLHARLLRVVVARTTARRGECEALLPRFEENGVRRTDAADEHLGLAGPGADLEALTPELAERVRACIGELPAHLRTVLLLCEVEGLDPSQTAELFGVDLPTVRRRLHRARQALRLLVGRTLAASAPLPA